MRANEEARRVIAQYLKIMIDGILEAGEYGVDVYNGKVL
jgi:hypothetical protein